MIAGFRDEWLRAFFVDDIQSKNVPPDLERRLFRKLQMIDDATTDQDLRVPPSNHFEKLRGDLAGFHSIRVNKQWRLIFRWDGRRGEALEFISTTIATDEARHHAEHEAQAGDGRRDSDREFMGPMGLTQGAFAEAMGVQRKHVNELCDDRRNVTARRP